MYIRYEGYLIRVVHRSNARRLSLTSHRGAEGLTMTVPLWARQRDVEQFLKENLPWIRAHAVSDAAWHPSYAPGEIHPCLGSRVILGEGGVPSGEALLRWRQACLEDLIARLLPVWEEKMQVRVHTLRFRDTRSQWGSCQTATRTITLAVNLGKVPRECVEYILVHELCHLHHPDHSPAFHAEMTALLPDWKARKAALRSFDFSACPGERAPENSQ